jgi:hypothetical protein
MMKNYLTTGTFSRGKKRRSCQFIVSQPPHESQCKLKRTDWAINVVNPAAPEYLRWSESSTTFDQIDHPDSIRKPRRFPLIINPLARTTQLTKALLDGVVA